ncbi:hypothetical protein AU196_23025 [Mycobacterium sp. IS-1742]|uniref:hypothetical protein n=1 Tax=Mycobacterium sp. IS-1742 TaxID=1772285 RepID=UPI00073FE17B|nr:hypothetical protein [Mycobacterium sp. IS-1742]KUI25836.1 hypothetical protein AU196_23025 [Mycobacterium sp. IS-1742]
MTKHATALGAAVLFAAGTLGMAGPASAAEAWAMPDVEGMILQQAWDEILSTSDGALVPETSAADGTPYEQINLTNWVVCEQSPSEGGVVTADEPPELEVARPNQCE